MLDRRDFLVLLACCPVAAAQGLVPVSPEVLQFATGQASRFEQYTNPVVSTHALASLAALVCGHDASAGAGLFRKTLARLDNTPDSIFVEETSPVLPISSFTSLWRLVTASAVKCDAALARQVDVERVQSRLTGERQQANFGLLPKAASRIALDPERAAQLADLMLTAGDIELLSFQGLGGFLAKLRERSPELGDRVFIKAVDAVASARAPSTAVLNELGKYLFVDPQQREFPDENNLFRDVFLQSSTITDFRAVRYSTNPEPVEAYVRALLRMILDSSANANFDANVAYSVAYQTLAHANDMGLDTKDLAEVFPRIATTAGPSVRAAIGTMGVEGIPLGAERSRALGRILTAVRGKQFSEARQMLERVDDENTRAQVAVLIDFGEAATALANGELSKAIQLANGVRPAGFKRALLYSGLVAAGDLRHLSLAMDDAALLPLEFRAAILVALADALFKVDPERSFSILPALVQAINSARTAPRQGRFDPRRVRGAVRQGIGASTDIPFIPLSAERFYEVVDTNGSRHAFDLTVPKVTVFTLTGLLLRTADLDMRRLEAAALDLRGEMQQAAALLAIAESHLKSH